jgi:hypothetical protein
MQHTLLILFLSVRKIGFIAFAPIPLIPPIQTIFHKNLRFIVIILQIRPQTKPK